jgi:hypothetical protein
MPKVGFGLSQIVVSVCGGGREDRTKERTSHCKEAGEILDSGCRRRRRIKRVGKLRRESLRRETLDGGVYVSGRGSCLTLSFDLGSASLKEGRKDCPL